MLGVLGRGDTLVCQVGRLGDGGDGEATRSRLLSPPNRIRRSCGISSTEDVTTTITTFPHHHPPPLSPPPPPPPGDLRSADSPAHLLIERQKSRPRHSRSHRDWPPNPQRSPSDLLAGWLAGWWHDWGAADQCVGKA